MSVFLLSMRILFGCLFITSAVLKLFPIEYFEMVLVDQTGISWHYAPWFSRILIWFEAALGVSMVFGFRLRESYIASMILLLVFSLYLLFQISMGNGDENCGCFGELVPLDGPSSIAKNGVMFLWVVLLFWKGLNNPQWKLPWLAPVLGGASIIALFIAFPLPSFSDDADFKLDLELLQRPSFENDSPMEDGNKVVVVMLANCVHCAQLAKLISTMDPTSVSSDLRIIVVGKEEGYDYFLNETGIQDFQVTRSTDQELIASIDGTFPTLIHVSNGEVKSKWLGRDVNISLLTQVLNLK